MMRMIVGWLVLAIRTAMGSRCVHHCTLESAVQSMARCMNTVLTSPGSTLSETANKQRG